MKKYYSGMLILASLSSLVFAVTVHYLIPEEPVYIEKFTELPKIPLSDYNYKFGKSKDSLATIHGEVKRNETFLQILNKCKITLDQAKKLFSPNNNVFNFANIHAGRKYTVYQTPDSIAQTKYIVYEANPLETIILKFDDSVTVTKEEKKIDVIRRGIGGTITSSLYESMQDQNVPVQLAYELSKIFATKVDFFKIHEGDNFKIIYDEVDINGASIGIEKIHAAYIEHDKQKFYAINFEENGKDQFYDEQANSMQQGFLKAPLKYFRISSKFTKRRFHPVQKIFKAHLGTDYAAPTGTPILTVGKGVVEEAKYSRLNGNYVKIKHNNTYSTQYLHMSKIARGIKPGKRVVQGQVIGFVGSTGLATGPHVCYRFWKNGKQVDPSEAKVTYSVPMNKSRLADFNKTKKEVIEEMGKIKFELAPS
jgi:murein DD-endopeptidase MepM/ murein hydrolase activator NlpD